MKEFSFKGKSVCFDDGCEWQTENVSSSFFEGSEECANVDFVTNLMYEALAYCVRDCRKHKEDLGHENQRHYIHYVVEGELIW